MSETKVTLDAIRDVLGLLDQARKEADSAATAALISARAAAEPPTGEDGESRAVLVDSAVVRYEVAHGQQSTATLLGLLGGKLLAAIQQEESVLAGDVAPTIETVEAGPVHVGPLLMGGPAVPLPFPHSVHLLVDGDMHHRVVPLRYDPWIGEWTVELPPHLHDAARKHEKYVRTMVENEQSKSLPDTRETPMYVYPEDVERAADLRSDMVLSEDHPDPDAPRVFHDPEPGYGADHEPHSENN